MNSAHFNPYNAFFVPAYDILTTTLALLDQAAATAHFPALLLDARIPGNPMPLRAHCNLVAMFAEKLAVSAGEVPGYGWTRDDALPSLAAVRMRLEAAQELLAAGDKYQVHVRVTEAMIEWTGGPGQGVQVPLHVYISAFVLPNMYLSLATVFYILSREGLVQSETYIAAFERTVKGKPGLWEHC